MSDAWGSMLSQAAQNFGDYVTEIIMELGNRAAGAAMAAGGAIANAGAKAAASVPTPMRDGAQVSSGGPPVESPEAGRGRSREITADNTPSIPKLPEKAMAEVAQIREAAPSMVVAQASLGELAAPPTPSMGTGRDAGMGVA